MSSDSATCWTLIEAAAAGSSEERDRFARYYGPVVRAYLRARWRKEHRDLDDVLQDVFYECFREGGALEKVEARRPGGFRAFLYGITRNVTSRYEQRHGRRREQAMPSDSGVVPPDGDDGNLQRVFDRAWAVSTVRQALERQRRLATQAGDAEARRVKLLELRFQDGLPIREIARRWEVDAAHLHHEYARGRKEFETALKEVVSFHLPNAPDQVDGECRDLLGLLQG